MKKFTTWDLLYAINMAIACGIAYAVVTLLLGRFVDKHDELLAGMWAVVAAVFVYRDTRDNSLSAGLDRLLATCVSFALCLAYLLLFRFNVLGMAVVIGLGAVAMALLDRRDDIVTTGITTAVVLVVAASSSHDAWHQPILRLIDTVVGMGVGIACKWAGSYIFYHAVDRHMDAHRKIERPQRDSQPPSTSPNSSRTLA
jgi:uncharacterized membrane protein YgaE (UPF0421/DUF939 family)